MKIFLKLSKIREAFSDIGFKQANDKPEHLPFVRKLSVGKQYLLYTVLTVSMIAASSAMFFYYFSRVSQMDQRVESSTELKMLSQRIGKNLQKAIIGDNIAYKLVEIDFDTFKFFINKYKQGFGTFEKLDSDVASQIIPPIQTKYDILKPKMDLLVRNKDVALNLNNQGKNISKIVNEMNLNLEEVYNLGIQRGTEKTQLLAIQTLRESLINFNKNYNEAVGTSNNSFLLVSDLNADYVTIQRMFQYLLDDEPVKDFYLSQKLDAIRKVYEPQIDSASELLKEVGPFLEAKSAVLQTVNVFDSLYFDADKLKDISAINKESLVSLNYYGYLFLVFALAFIVLIGYTNLKETQISAWKTKKENDETDNAVIGLMEELIPISEGNLKARTTITEHVTGALADRINFMAESLQAAVRNTRETSEKVSTQTADLKRMIAAASELSSNAEARAKKTNDASIAGSITVNQAAERMEEARDKMQETSKRVKRLGEVSQSIGLVTDLIEEMTEKTAVLALNTQLKAAESGSDGNSFRVIAQEIRKLSDDAKKSLTTIRNSVQNMQSETSTVMLSIEQTTANVVEGSVLWGKAESDLKLIQEAAKNIEEITLQLNALSEQQVEKAQETESNMSDLNKSISDFTV